MSLNRKGSVRERNKDNKDHVFSIYQHATEEELSQDEISQSRH